MKIFLRAVLFLFAVRSEGQIEDRLAELLVTNIAVLVDKLRVKERAVLTVPRNLLHGVCEADGKALLGLSPAVAQSAFEFFNGGSLQPHNYCTKILELLEVLRPNKVNVHHAHLILLCYATDAGIAGAVHRLVNNGVFDERTLSDRVRQNAQGPRSGKIPRSSPQAASDELCGLCCTRSG